MTRDTLTDRESVEALAVELEDEFRCRCDVAYTDRGLHAPECQAYMLPSSVTTIRALLSRAEKAEAERDEAGQILRGIREDVGRQVGLMLGGCCGQRGVIIGGRIAAVLNETTKDQTQ